MPFVILWRLLREYCSSGKVQAVHICVEQTRVFQKSKDWCEGDLFFEDIESTAHIVTLPTSYKSKSQLAKTFMTVRKPMLAAVPLIKGWPLFKLSIGKGGAALSNKIKIPFLRRVATPLVGVVTPLYKRVSWSLT